MGELVLKNVKQYMDGYDFSGQLNQTTVSFSADIKDKTVFGSSGRKRTPGLTSVEISSVGFFSASSSSEVSPVLYNKIGGNRMAFSVIPEGTAVGNICYSAYNLAGEYSPGAPVGELMSFNLAAYGEGGPLIRGEVFEIGSKSSDSNSTSRELGNRGSTQRVYGALQVITMSTSAGVTFDCNLLTDSSSDMGASPTTLLSFTQCTTDSIKTAEIKSTQGSTTDNFYQFEFVFSSSATAKVVCSAGLR